MALYINGNKMGGGGTDVVHLTQAEYDALPSSKNYDDKVYLITDVNGDGSQFQPVIYSEDEREIGVWIDGKPLYQKTLKLSSTISISSESWGNIATLSEQLDINYAEGVYDTGSETVYYVLGANCDTNKLLTVLNYRNQQIELNEITLRYTRPTDTAGSGTWTPQGVPAVHYSTDEQVVGTWIDGKTIYQKTIQINSPSTYLDDVPNISGIDTLIFVDGFLSSTYNSDKYIRHIDYQEGNTIALLVFQKADKLKYKTEFSGETDRVAYITIQYTKTSLQGDN